MKIKNLEKAGVIGVDAGLCWIGDPCYILHKSPEDFPTEQLGSNWSEFCKIVFAAGVNENGTAQMGACLGVVTSTGYGDGTYPVYVQRNKDGRIVKIVVDFDQNEEGPEDENY